ncbi:MAG: type I restriction enzyme HsdR N-terminal domain-containing protein, partial [Bacteroidota bacterium]
MTWQEKVEQIIKKSKKKVVELDLEKGSISYSDEIKKHENITKVSGDEEVSRAFLINRLVNDLGYKARAIEIEKQFGKTGRKTKNHGENDVIVQDDKGNAFFFIEAKRPEKFEEDQKYIESQQFNLAKLQGKVKYLVWYTTDFQDGKIVDKAIIIDYKKYPEFADWEKDGRPSVGNEIPAGYGKPKKKEWIKGKNDLIKQINRDQINQLATNLHNFLWGGGGTSDTEIFYSLVNIILAKIQDEGEKTKGKKYDFQVFGYEGSLEDGESVYE